MHTPWNWDDNMIDIHAMMKEQEARNVAMGLNPDGTIDTYAMIQAEADRKKADEDTYYAITQAEADRKKADDLSLLIKKWDL